MEIYLTFLAIAVIEIFIVDLSGSIQGLVHPIVKKIFGINKNTNIHIPLIECSLCVVFHTGWIFLLCIGEFNAYNFLFTSLISFFSKNISGFLLWIRELLIKIETLLYKLIR